MIHKGERYRAERAMKVGVMTSWAAPCTGGEDGILPDGEEFVVANDPPEGATAVYCDPVRYDQLHAYFVSAKDRRSRRYRGYYLCVPIAAILAECIRVSAADPETDESPRRKPLPRPWDQERQSVERGGAIGVLVQLLNAGADTYRLVPADEVGPMTFRLRGSVPLGEVWAFQPGDDVRCLIKVFSAGEPGEWLAVERSDA